MNLPGLLRLFRRSGPIDLRYWPDAGIDLAFAALNSALWSVQEVAWGRRLSSTPIPTDPVFVIGHWRTGTTLLHELLGLDSSLRVPNAYECFLPHHFPLTQRWLKPCSGFALPATRPPDNMRIGWDLPQEDEFALCNLGLPSPYLTMAFPNQGASYDAYFELDRLSATERHEWQQTLLGFLRRLLSIRSGRLVLKSPTHSFRIPTLVSMFPNAAFIYLVRDPWEVYPSTVNLWRSLVHTHGYQVPDESWIPEFVQATFIRLHRRVQATRTLARRWVEIRYEELARQPLATIEMIYKRLDLGDFSAVKQPLSANLQQRASYQRNRYSLDERQRSQIAERWRDVFDCYGYPISPEKLA